MLMPGMLITVLPIVLGHGGGSRKYDSTVDVFGLVRHCACRPTSFMAITAMRRKHGVLVDKWVALHYTYYPYIHHVFLYSNRSYFFKNVSKCYLSSTGHGCLPG
jgi:hypothetical protein